MSEFIMISALEFGLILYFYSRVLGPRGFRNPSLLQQNPNLRWCFYIRRFCTPVIFSVNVFMALMWVEGIPTFIDLLTINTAVVLFSLLVGTLLSEGLVSKLKSAKIGGTV
jgi:hypothetical protein